MYFNNQEHIAAASHLKKYFQFRVDIGWSKNELLINRATLKPLKNNAQLYNKERLINCDFSNIKR